MASDVVYVKLKLNIVRVERVSGGEQPQQFNPVGNRLWWSGITRDTVRTVARQQRPVLRQMSFPASSLGYPMGNTYFSSSKYAKSGRPNCFRSQIL